MLTALVDAAAGGTPIAIVTRLRRRGRDLAYAGRLFVDAAGRVTGRFDEAPPDSRLVTMAVDQLRHGAPRVVTLDDEHEALIEPVAPRPRLFVAGGGHVALAIARQAQLLDFDVTILEDRPEFADPSRFGGATVLQGDVPTTIASLDYGWNSYLVVATRGHKLDADCVLAAAGTKVTVLIRDMLREHGIADDRLHAIHAPVGLDLGGRTPAEIALSVLAEITQQRYQATGRPLGQGRREDQVRS
jgi:xanthine dehydrogenase accessory factor